MQPTWSLSISINARTIHAMETIAVISKQKQFQHKPAVPSRQAQTQAEHVTVDQNESQ